MNDISLNDKRTQVAAQCRALVYMAKAIAEVYEDRACQYVCASPADKLLDIVGNRSAQNMESLGEILNSMDAILAEDSWLEPIFEEAQRLWPLDPPIRALSPTARITP